MQSEKVTVNEKEIDISEKKIKELKALAGRITENIKLDDLIKGETSAEIINNLIGTIKDKLIIVFPDLTPEDIEEAYPSELKNLIDTFIKVNFGEVQGLKNVFTLLLKLM